METNYDCCSAEAAIALISERDLARARALRRGTLTESIVALRPARSRLGNRLSWEGAAWLALAVSSLVALMMSF